jgi:hypothetical protein
MATRQGIDSGIANRLSDDHQTIFFAVKAEFDTDDILIWSGTDDLIVNSETYTGAGSLLSISGVEEDLEMRSSGLTIAVSGMDDTVLNYALEENYQNRPITLFMGFLMGGSNESAGEMVLFKGRMTAIAITDTAQGTNISMDCENRLVDLERPSNLRYTLESQQFLHNGDTGFNRVQQLQDKQITWGQKQDSGNSGGGGTNTSEVYTIMR